MTNSFTTEGISRLRVDALDCEGMVALTRRHIANGARTLIASHNLHSVYLFARDSKMRAFYDLSATTNVDGLPVVAIARMLGKRVKRSQRIGALDWAPLVLQEAARARWRVFYLGSAPGVAAKGANTLIARYPGLNIETRDGFFDADRSSPENVSVVESINRFQPHILMVGMGMPRQEHWLVDNFEDLNANVIFPVGAFMDYIAGASPSPPRWLGPVGLEWLYRLFSEPRRLWKRYLVEPWFVVLWLLRNMPVVLGATRRRAPH